MHGEDLARGYLLLTFRLERLQPGGVDAYGPVIDLRDQVSRERRPMASDLVRAAGTLAAGLPSTYGGDRADFLRGQLVACEWAARRLAGQVVPFTTEVAAAFGVRITLGPEDAYRTAHRDLDALLPGSGDLTERMALHRRRDEMPPGRLDGAVRALSEALRARTVEWLPLPEGESVTYRIVDHAPWAALHRYLGGYRSEVVLNSGPRPRCVRLARLIAHEAYPGHHTERCLKEAGVIARGWDEHRVVLANSPQSLIAEGAAELGLRALVGPGWGPWVAEVLAGAGIVVDGELAERVDDATSVLARVRQDAALLLHGRGAPVAEAVHHLRRWALVGEAGAGQVVRFLQHPVWRAYTTAYVEGESMLRRWWEQGPEFGDRFRRLLEEPITPGAVLVELAGGGAPGRPDGRQPNVA